MSQVPSVTIEYEQSWASICPPSCDAHKEVLAQVIDAPQQPSSDSEVTPNDVLLGPPAWLLGATGPGRETR
jgi:hypothetical protein